MKQKRVAILATNGFEEVELTSPKQALIKAGADVDVISETREPIEAWNKNKWGDEYPVDKSLDQVNQSDYDGLVLPGGLLNPDTLRQNKKAVQFVRSFFDNHKPVAAICHGPWLLAEADVLKGRRITSYPSIQTDMKNAGAEWVDEEVVVDNGLVTSRSPKDLEAFNSKVVEEIYEGKHTAQTA